MTDKYYDLIHPLLTEKGELGVNEIARAIDLPLSSVQKYLERQNHFKKTERRKWDLPDRVNSDIKSDTLSLMVTSVETQLLLLKAQLADITQNVENSLIPIDTLKRGVNSIQTPVAGKTDKVPDIDPELLIMDKKVKDLYAVFKRFVGKCPEEYQDLLKNLNIGKIIVEKGFDYLSGSFNVELSSLFLEKETELSEDVLSVLKAYQKGTNYEV
jgi:hypothetical protein